MAAEEGGGGSPGWTPSSWRTLPIVQQPKYAHPEELRAAAARLSALPPLVARAEVDSLLRDLADCAAGRRFLLQGGDCAERFSDCTEQHIMSQMRIVVQMSLVLVHSTSTPIIRVGRIAGQYAKPRSSDTEVVEGYGQIPSFRGDNINAFEPGGGGREPSPARLVEGYFHAAATANFMRVALKDGLADLRKANQWDMGFVKNRARRSSYQAMANQIVSSLDFIETCGLQLDPLLRSVDFFTSHEGLHLEYEEAMTSARSVEDREAGKGTHSSGHEQQVYYNLGAHMLWIGDRTRQLDHAHVE
jgi:3-deoxy-7-phosphoheptulonate synthase